MVRPEREVAQIVTPGTLGPEYHFVLAISAAKQYCSHFFFSLSFVDCAWCIDEWRKIYREFGLAWTDITTGEVHVSTVSAEFLGDEIATIGPVEVIVPSRFVLW
jgi:DNA mismatch repair ATPase MutS